MPFAELLSDEFSVNLIDMLTKRVRQRVTS